MSGIMRASPHLPSVTMVSIDNLFLVVMVCVLVEVYIHMLMIRVEALHSLYYITDVQQ